MHIKHLSVLPILSALVALGVLTAPACAADLPLERLRLPDGFSAEIYGEADNARQMALSDSGVLYVGSRRAGKVTALVDRDGDGRAEETRVIAEDLTLPSGLTWRDGDLYVGAVSTIYRFADIDNHLDNPPQPEVILDDLPTETHHGWKYLKFGPDGLLYVPVGAPCNICDPEEPFATIMRLDVDTPAEREIVARGVRNSVGFDWDPATDDLWFTDNGRDHLGDEIPPCELNHVSAVGQHFGYPYFHGNGIADPEYGSAGKSLDAYRKPALALGPHVAPVGMTFYAGEQFPERYRGDVILAEHGSWNRSEAAGPIGYRLIHAESDPSGELHYEVFIDGWLNADGTRWGRPADVLTLHDGSIVVADDEAGVVYRISYTGS